MRYLSLAELLDLHQRVLAQSGGSPGLPRLPALESAIALPRQTFGGADLYPSLEEKAAILGFALIQGHPFVDGNKRVGHAAMETFLMLNGSQLTATTEEGEQAILGVAASRWQKEDLLAWVRQYARAIQK